MYRRTWKRGLCCCLGVGMLALGPVWGDNYDKDYDHSKISIPGLYQGVIPEFNEPIVVKIEADGTWTHITPTELEKETTSIGSWKHVRKKHHTNIIKWASITYFRDDFCQDTFGAPDCLFYNGGTAKIDKQGHLTGTIGLSIQRADNTGEIVHLGVFTLDLQMQPLGKIRKIALTPTE